MSFTAPTIEKNVEQIKTENEKKFEIERELIKKIKFLLTLNVGDSFLLKNEFDYYLLKDLGLNFGVVLNDNTKDDRGEVRVWRIA